MANGKTASVSAVTSETQRKPVPEDQSSVVALHAESWFTGPLPPPEALERYERLAPGCADRLLRLLEEQQREAHAKTRRAQYLAGAVAVLLIVSAVVCALVGATAIGCALVGATLVGALSKFLPDR